MSIRIYYFPSVGYLLVVEHPICLLYANHATMLRAEATPGLDMYHAKHARAI